MKRYPEKHMKHMKIAKVLAETFSKCLSRKISSIVIDDDNTIIATGYNGPPRGVSHCNSEARKLQIIEQVKKTYPPATAHLAIEEFKKNWDGKTCPRRHLGFGSGEGLQFCPAGHAETNAIFNAARSGVKLKGGTMICWCPLPCMECAKGVINSGIKRVVCWDGPTYDHVSPWLFAEAGIPIEFISKELLEEL
jgi:dCMP deaminase